MHCKVLIFGKLLNTLQSRDLDNCYVKTVFRVICRQQRPRSGCASAHPDQGLHYLPTESLHTRDYIDVQHKPLSACIASLVSLGQYCSRMPRTYRLSRNTPFYSILHVGPAKTRNSLCNSTWKSDQCLRRAFFE